MWLGGSIPSLRLGGSVTSEKQVAILRHDMLTAKKEAGSAAKSFPQLDQPGDFLPGQFFGDIWKQLGITVFTGIRIFLGDFTSTVLELYWAHGLYQDDLGYNLLVYIYIRIA